LRRRLHDQAAEHGRRGGGHGTAARLGSGGRDHRGPAERRRGQRPLVTEPEGARMGEDAPMPHRLERFLAEVDPDSKATVVSYTPISGGYSRVTALAEVRWADVSHEKLIL